MALSQSRLDALIRLAHDQRRLIQDICEQVTLACTSKVTEDPRDFLLYYVQTRVIPDSGVLDLELYLARTGERKREYMRDRARVKRAQEKLGFSPSNSNSSKASTFKSAPATGITSASGIAAGFEAGENAGKPQVLVNRSPAGVEEEEPLDM